MPSGMEQVVENTLERLVSEDVNRLQLFKERDIAEVLRYLLDVYQGTDDTQAGALSQEVTSLGTPLRAEVIGGLLVQPQQASLSLAVAPGVLYAINPDSPPNPDVSPFQYVRDPGVQALGALVIGANATGSARVDVVECQPMVVVAEQDSRDFYDEVTGLFTPATVVKATLANLTYRVRAGSPGAGFPGVATGWLPLCVANVHAGATSNDQVDFWDVRPLVSDRAFGVANVGNFYPDVEGDLLCEDGSAPTLVQGEVTAVLGGRRVGGQLLRGTPGVDPASGFDLGAAANQDPALSSAVTTNSGVLWYLYLVCPFGLPRWAFYTPPGAGPRVPRSPRGIPVVSDVYCLNTGAPNAPVPLPTAAFGAATADANAVCVAAVPRRYSGGTPWSMQGKFVEWGYEDPAGLNLFVNTAVIGSGDGVAITYATSGSPLRLPPCAVRARFCAGFCLAPGAASAGEQTGTVTLASSIATVSGSITVTSTSRVLLQITAPSGTIAAHYVVSSVVVGGPGTGSFAIVGVDASGSPVAGDDSTLAWVIVDNENLSANTGWHYQKTLTVSGASGPSTRGTVREGVVWLPREYFNNTTVNQQDCVTGDFALQNPLDGTSLTYPTFTLRLFSGDNTVAYGATGTAPHIMVPNFAGTLTAGGFLGYWNP